jgi:hypothetical protein
MALFLKFAKMRALLEEQERKEREKEASVGLFFRAGKQMTNQQNWSFNVVLDMHELLVFEDMLKLTEPELKTICERNMGVTPISVTTNLRSFQGDERFIFFKFSD